MKNWLGGGSQSSQGDAPDSESTSLLGGAKKRIGSFGDYYLWYINEYNERVHVIFGGIWMILGVVMFQAITACLILTAIYLIVQILTTIGYGDVVPTNNAGKYMTSVYALGTIIFLGACFNVFLNAIAKRVEESRKNAEKQGPSLGIEDSFHALEIKLFGHWRDCFWEFVLFAIFVAFGTIFYATYEACTCSYGVTAIEGCSDTSYKVCVLSGGSTKTWLDSFYMVVISLTTIGFGDYTPQSYFGRVVFIPWALLGVVSMGRFATTFGSALGRTSIAREPLVPIEELRNELRKDFREVLGKDVEESDMSSLTLAEFSFFLLKQHGTISANDVKVAREAWNNMTSNRIGSTATFEDIIDFVKDSDKPGLTQQFSYRSLD